MYSPMILSATGSLASGGSIPLDSSRLSNTFRTPMIVDEIRFIVRTPTASSNSSTLRFNLGGSIRVKLTAGKLELTNGFVPLWNLSPNYQRLSQYKSVSTFRPNGEELAQSVGDVSAGIFYNHFRWLLPCKFWMPPGMSISAVISRAVDGVSGSVATGNATVDVAIVGRAVTGRYIMPKTTQVPWASCWVGTAGTGGTDLNTVQRSGQLDLINPYLSTIKIQRMIGRLQLFNSTDLVLDDDIRAGVETATTTPDPVKVKIADSRGNIVTRDFANFYDVFYLGRRAWTFDTELKPKERINVEVTRIPDGDTPFVSLIGSRVEALRNF